VCVGSLLGTNQMEEQEANLIKCWHQESGTTCGRDAHNIFLIGMSQIIDQFSSRIVLWTGDLNPSRFLIVASWIAISQKNLKKLGKILDV